MIEYRWNLYAPLSQNKSTWRGRRTMRALRTNFCLRALGTTSRLRALLRRPRRNFLLIQLPGPNRKRERSIFFEIVPPSFLCYENRIYIYKDNMNTVTDSSTTVLSTSTPPLTVCQALSSFPPSKFPLKEIFVVGTQKKREKCAPDFVENIYEATSRAK